MDSGFFCTVYVCMLILGTCCAVLWMCLVLDAVVLCCDVLPTPIKHRGYITSRCLRYSLFNVPLFIRHSATIFSSIPHSIDTSLWIHQTQFQTPLALRNGIKHCHSTKSHEVHELPYMMGISMNMQGWRITWITVSGSTSLCIHRFTIPHFLELCPNLEYILGSKSSWKSKILDIGRWRY